MKKTNSNGTNAATNAIFYAGMPSATYKKPQTNAIQDVVKYGNIKRGAMVLIDAELRGFNANIKALKANANLPALVELMNADALTFEMFTIEYLQKWQSHRFNGNNALCNLVVITDKNRGKCNFSQPLRIETTSERHRQRHNFCLTLKKFNYD